ncbi:ester cyclase [Chondrinema litorale]|uniref:ester cyclase n=1 Tax=Chondrinema litorale TaxID=2994555 RepID=UPI002542FE07|nr:ester cyclase [Chondrinema litorale]UZR96181.1 ester cyclase [Chondrinema litorale]
MNTLELNKHVVNRFNKEFLQDGDTSILQDIVSEEFVNHTIPAGFPSDVTGLIKFAEILHQGFPDLSITIHEQTAENDLVSSLKTIEGTHSGELMGKPATGKKVKITVIDMVRLKDGKYVDHWGQNNFMQAMQQL